MCLFKSLLLCVLLFSVVVTVTSADDEYKIVETRNGRIRGIRKSTLLKKISFYSFKGIPYAKPPLDDLRFKVNEIVRCVFLSFSIHFNQCFRRQNQSNHGHQQHLMHLNTVKPVFNLNDFRLVHHGHKAKIV